MNTLTAREELRRLSDLVTAGDWGLAEAWGGAGVVIVDSAPVPVENAWFHDDLFVVTPYVRELSWLFERARDAVCDHDDYGMFKHEFFGRMGEAVNACGTEVPVTAHLNVALFAARFFVESVLRESI